MSAPHIRMLCQNPELQNPQNPQARRPCSLIEKNAKNDESCARSQWERWHGTTGVVDGKSIYMEYAAPVDVPRLMDRWLTDFNKTRSINGSAQAVAAYVRTHMVFVRIHPFFDGNGRMARLIANLPVLSAGFPPILVPMSRGGDYIDLLWHYQNAVGRIGRGSRLLPPHPTLREFESLLLEEWKKSTSIVEEASQLHTQRRSLTP